MTLRSDRPELDLAIETALQRIRTRALPLGDSVVALSEALGRAARGGKRFRPALVCDAFQAFGGDTDEVPGLHQIAAAFELLHAAFVVHDDVIDHDTVRRGVPNVAGEFRVRARTNGADADGTHLLGETAAILAGDLLLHEALRLAATADVPPDARVRILDLLDDAVLVSAAGELSDVEHSVLPADADADELLATAFHKTAVYSFRAPLLAGAVLAGASDRALVRLEQDADRLGLAFQLVDDLIGAFGSAEQAGRESGGDLRESKLTALVALARQSAAWPQVDSALQVARTGPIAVRAAQRALEASGAGTRLRELIDDTLDQVRTDDDEALPRPARRMLHALADRIQERMP
ncbi:polyprenyl synthetase family protein [Microbacterium thalassium]|uniref:Geranylgeranyl diphosphate synthase type II n=1 Tax=Microbacterium thalassium TaxID=362649 RepID=A0A7X0FSM3_9MICO|nr:polyprenyl synthetase family protein [Microbacterium thalassium]MBB6392276.1 geranylgeranyl diphosphate synthase type II [Microbacterium thalassium]GLK23486.1 geranylgeranyl pyrophosphate synthase [Microbacterium thalassium]